MKKDTDKNFVRVYDTLVPGSLRSELDYEMVESKNGKSILKILLKTGRPHQIRTQLSHVGCPIVGNVKYGASKQIDIETYGEKHTMPALCATSLMFKLATLNEEKTIVVDIPKEWNNYI